MKDTDRKIETKSSQDPDGLSKGDAAVLEALRAAVDLSSRNFDLKTLTQGPFAKISDGNGPFQAIKGVLPGMSNEAAVVLARLINKDTGKQSYNSGDELYAPKDAYSKLNAAQLRQLLKLPLSATDKELSDLMSKQNADSLRKSLGLPSDATDKEVSDLMSRQNSESLRKSLGLPPDATDKEVSDLMSRQNSESLRKSLDLPVDATDEAVDRALKAKLDKLLPRLNPENTKRIELD